MLPKERGENGNPKRRRFERTQHRISVAYALALGPDPRERHSFDAFARKGTQTR